MSSPATRPGVLLLLSIFAGCASGHVDEQRSQSSASGDSSARQGRRSDAMRESDASPADGGACSECDAAVPNDGAAAADSGGSRSDAASDRAVAGSNAGETMPDKPATIPAPPAKPLDSRAVQTDSPFAIAPSAASSRSLDSWIGSIAKIGVQWIRNFDASTADERLATLKSNKLQVSGTLVWSASTNLTFPVNDLTGWRAYVKSTVQQHKDQVRYWEVWNEPPNFTEDKSPADYAKIVVAAFEEVKAIDPTIQVGIAAQSNNVNFLDQALVAGAAAHFDYVTLHPYELLGLVSSGWEPMLMRVVPTLRRMLAARDPARANAPIWFTEIGQAVTAPVTEADQADSLIKAYSLGLAQGVARIAWFEGVDGDSGPFGLISAAGQMRPAYNALKTLIAQLGPNPRYFGWVLLNGRHYGFVFEGPQANVLVTWARPKMNESVAFDAPVKIIVPATGNESTAASYALTPSPVIISGISAKLVDEAHANRMRTFPWSGDAASSDDVSYTAPEATKGLHLRGDTTTANIAGETAIDCSTRSGQVFAVDPAYVSYDPVPLKITVVVRRQGTTAAGFNFKYESTTGFKNLGTWYDIPTGDQWTTASWTVTDTQFVGMWGYNFVLESDKTAQSQYFLKSVSVAKQ